MMTRLTVILGMLAASCGVVCAGEPGPIADPFGDAFDTFGDGEPLLDIDTLGVTYDATDVHVTMTFYTPIAPASAEVPESITGLIEFDTDQDAGTGVPALQTGFSPPFADLEFGTDFGCDLFSEVFHPGFIDIVTSVDFDVVATVPITFGETSLAFSVPLSALGDDGLLDFTSIIGTEWQPTDAMEVVGESVPGPAALTLLSLAGVVRGRGRRR